MKMKKVVYCIAGRFFTNWAIREAWILKISVVKWMSTQRMGVFLKLESWFSQAFLIGALGISIRLIWASLVAQRLKHLPPMRETWVRSLGREDPLEKEMAIHSSLLAWRISWMEKPGRLQSMGSQRVGHDWATSPSPSGTEFAVPSWICVVSLICHMESISVSWNSLWLIPGHLFFPRSEFPSWTVIWTHHFWIDEC